jgi:putative flippase GtrA
MTGGPAWLRHMTAYRTPIRYSLVVLCGYSVDFLLYMLLVANGVAIYGANAVGFSVGSVVNVLLIRRFVFLDARFSLLVDLQLSFMSNAVMLALGMLLLWALFTLANMNPYVAKVAANCVTFLINYLIRKVFFGERRLIVF